MSLAHAYYAADLILAASFPFAAWWLDRLDRQTWRMFWLGVAIGALWEIPIFALSAWTARPVIEWLTPLVLPPPVFIAAHSLWDGALLTGGWLLARRLTGRPAAPAGVGVQVAWGQITELCVELSAIAVGAWVYLDGVWFNPPLFHVAGHPITLGLQLIWLAAPLLFAALAPRVTRTRQAPRQ